MKKTAVEWLVEQLPTIDNSDPYYQKIINEAKEREKQSKLDLIRFMRTSDKMGKSLEDLYDEFCG